MATLRFRPVHWLAVAAVLLMSHSPNVAGELYVVDASNDQILRILPDGSRVDVVVRGLHDPTGIAIDEAAEMLYWTDGTQIQCATLAGANVEVLVDGGRPVWIALDAVAGELYWTDYDARTIMRADVDGSNVEKVLHVPPASPGSGGLTGIALDLDLGHIYFGDQSHDNISRANLDGTELQTVVTMSQMGPAQIALDPFGGRLYWSDPVNPPGPPTSGVWRVGLDGADAEQILSVLGPWGAALEHGSATLFVSGPGYLSRANLDGSDSEIIYTDYQNGFFGKGIALTECRAWREPCSTDADCCTYKCRGPVGRKTCKQRRPSNRRTVADVRATPGQCGVLQRD